jgi:hypothetical protein
MSEAIRQEGIAEALRLTAIRTNSCHLIPGDYGTAGIEQRARARLSAHELGRTPAPPNYYKPRVLKTEPGKVAADHLIP